MDSSERSRAEEKVKKIFERFDKNEDGGLNRDELAALFLAVTPEIQSTCASHAEMIKLSLVDPFFEKYAEFVCGESGLTRQGLLHTYNSEIGNLDWDFLHLGLELNPADSAAAAPEAFQVRDVDELHCYNRNKLVEEVEISVARFKEKQMKYGKFKECDFDHIVHNNDVGWRLGALKPWELEPSSSSSSSAVSTGKIVIFKESGRHYLELRQKLRAVEAVLGDFSSEEEEAFCGHMEIGRVLYEHDLFKDALDSFKRASELQSTYAMPHFRAGNCYYILGRYEESKEEFSWALEAAQSSGTNHWDYLLPQIHINLGSSLEGIGMVSTAYDHYKEAVILCPTNFRALKLLGSALLGFGEYGTAEKTLVKAISLKPDYADAYCDLALVLNATGQRKWAIQGFQKAMELKPGHVNAMYNLGNLFMDVGEHQKSVEMYGNVLAICPNNWRAQFNRAVVLSWAGHSKEAKKAIQEALKMSKKVESHVEVIAHIKQLQEKMAKASQGAADDKIKVVLDKVHESHIKFINIPKGLLRTQAFRMNYEELIPLFVEKTAKMNQGADHEESNVTLAEILAPEPTPGRVLTIGSRRMRAKQ